MISASTAVAVTGVVIGATLMALGARDIRSPAISRRARLQVGLDTPAPLGDVASLQALALQERDRIT